MSSTLSDFMCATFTGGLGTLRAVLEAAESHATANSLAIAELLESRLAPDMFSFAQQIQAATDTSRRVTDRLSGADASSLPDPEPSIAALTERVDATLARVAAADRAKIDATADRAMTIDLGAGPMPFTGRSYVLGFGVPNFLFHVATAYDILRQQGAPLGKVIYITPFVAACARG